MRTSLTINRKLTLVLWGASLVMLAGGGTAYWWHEHTSAARMENALEPYAQLLGTSLAGPVSRGAGQPAINELLSALRAAPALVEARVTDAQGEVVGEYHRQGHLSPRPSRGKVDGLYPGDDGLVELVRNLKVEGQTVGRLHLWAVPAMLERDARFHSRVLLTMGLLLLGVTLWQSWLVRRMVASPVETLTAKVDGLSRQYGLLPAAEERPANELQRLEAHFEHLLNVVRQHEAALQKSNQFLQAVLANAAHAIISVDAHGTITSFNPAAERLLGYTAEEVVGRRTPLLFHDAKEIKQRAAELTQLTGQPVPADMEIFCCLPRRGQTDEREWTYVCRDGRRVPVWISVTTLRDAQGQILGFMGIAEDLTLRKQQEAELRHKNAEMERFIYTVSHDLKSPLVTIKGFAGELLSALREGRHEHLAQDLQRVMAATDKMSELLNDLLELSRVGRVMYPPTEVPLGQVVREALALLEGPLRERAVEVQVQPDWPVVHGDRRRLFEVYLNLLENAVKFMGPQPQPRVVVGWAQRPAGPVFFVEDNGIGVPPAYQETIFGLFNKLDSESPGTGLGLAIVRRIIEVHGGRIWVESEGRGRGSRFCFTLGPQALNLPSQPATETMMA